MSHRDDMIVVAVMAVFFGMQLAGYATERLVAAAVESQEAISYSGLMFLDDFRIVLMAIRCGLLPLIALAFILLGLFALVRLIKQPWPLPLLIGIGGVVGSAGGVWIQGWLFGDCCASYHIDHQDTLTAGSDVYQLAFVTAVGGGEARLILVLYRCENQGDACTRVGDTADYHSESAPEPRRLLFWQAGQEAVIGARRWDGAFVALYRFTTDGST
ncbi:MAG: hypothetical protein JNM70_21050 [Anaerolineae bacterium]|nr:hypothetical protein [Anaerolineae bacterium]